MLVQLQYIQLITAKTDELGSNKKQTITDGNHNLEVNIQQLNEDSPWNNV